MVQPLVVVDQVSHVLDMFSEVCFKGGLIKYILPFRDLLCSAVAS